MLPKSLENNIHQKLIKDIIYIVVSSQVIYILIHLQFLIGFPKATLSVKDCTFVIVTSIMSYTISRGNKWVYFCGMYAMLLIVFETQYFYMKIFNKVFFPSELKYFFTLMQVSSWDRRIGYSGFYLTWAGSLFVVLWHFIKNIKKYSVKRFAIIGASVVFFVSTFMYTEPLPIQFNLREIFRNEGIVSTIQKRIPNNFKPVSQEELIVSLDYLKQKESERTMYPISQSPATPPDKLRPIFVIIWESFYDYKHFAQFFDENPFPKEYLDTVKSNTYTGPPHSSGSFSARFNMLTSAQYNIYPNRRDNYYPTLPMLLRDYGYTTVSLESVTATYNLDKYYELWGMDESYYELYGDNWVGKDDANKYERNITEIIQNTPDDVVPFYFGFTYLGHNGSMLFTEQLEDPVGVDRYLSYFNKKDFALQQLKAGIFNAKRMMSVKNMILEKYPDALIVFKSDHYSTELNLIFQDSTFDKDVIDSFYNDPGMLPLLVFDGQNGLVDLPYGFSPSNLPLMILAESGLPYKGTVQSLLSIDMPEDIVQIYNSMWVNSDGKYIPTSEGDFPDLDTQLSNRTILSVDLYIGKQYALSNQN